MLHICAFYANESPSKHCLYNRFFKIRANLAISSFDGCIYHLDRFDRKGIWSFATVKMLFRRFKHNNKLKVNIVSHRIDVLPTKGSFHAEILPIFKKCIVPAKFRKFLF